MSGPLRPEDRCRSVDCLAQSDDDVVACRRSEAFAEDLPLTPVLPFALVPRHRLAVPRRRAERGTWLDGFRVWGLSAGT